jgi:hypothetical protein
VVVDDVLIADRPDQGTEIAYRLLRRAFDLINHKINTIIISARQSSDPVTVRRS